MKSPTRKWGVLVLALLASSLLTGVNTAHTQIVVPLAVPIPGGAGPIVLTDDSRLEGDRDCSGNPGLSCITFAAPGITLELNGFTVKGPELSDCPVPTQSVGIDTENQPNAEIKGPGKVQSFTDGVHIEGSNDSKVNGIVAIRNCINGILVDVSSRVEVKDNVVLHNGALGFVSGGISIAGDDNTVAENEVHHNGGDTGHTPYGIIERSGTRNLVKKNSVVFNGNGILLGFGSSSTVDENIVLDNAASDILFPGFPPPNSNVTNKNVCETGNAAVCANSPTAPLDADHGVGPRRP